MQNKRQIILVIILIGLLTAAGSFLTNVVSVGIVIPLWLAGSLLIVVIGLGIGLAVWQFLLQRDNETVTASQQDRQRLLAKVHSFWIKGVLEKSLYNVVHIELELHEQPDAIANPWHLVLQQQDQPAHPLPSSAHIIQVYDDALGELLILGEPGSGKTTLLLELARELLHRAVADENHPMPIVFNLSSWAVKRQPLTDWLVEEMNIKYQVPPKLGRSWVESDQVLPLLDGLDEVNSDHREACVDAINTYRLQHGLVSMVVCSRSADYLELKKRMLLRTAVVVQPLTMQEIDDYLSAAGEQLEAVLIAFRKDKKLQELVTTPLMLSVLTLAYHGKAVEDILKKGSLKARRQQVFETYVQSMLQRRSAENRYTPQQTIYWLAWLARQMKQHSQTEFYLEQMQGDWLPDARSRFIYRLVAWLLSGLLIGLVFALLFGLLIGLVFGLVGGLVVGLFFGLTQKRMDKHNLVAPNQGVWLSAQNGIRFGLLLGLVTGLLMGLPFVLRFGLFVGLLYELRFGLSFGLIYIMYYGGLAFIQHFVLRFLLWRAESMSWNYPRFLDYAADRILLRKVGGGYIFIHRLLQEYFASLDTTP
jgi:DNA polymerase III delta prime subunit